MQVVRKGVLNLQTRKKVSGLARVRSGSVIREVVGFLPNETQFLSKSNYAGHAAKMHDERDYFAEEQESVQTQKKKRACERNHFTTVVT